MPIAHGLKFNEPLTGARAIKTASSSVIGLVCTASDADATAYPLDTAVLITDVRKSIGLAGTLGTLKKTLEAIADQCSPIIVVVRVAEGLNAAATETNIIGTTTAQGKLTGMKALQMAETQLGVKPKIIAVPGFDTQAVVSALIPIVQKLNGFAYARGVGATVALNVTYRGNFSAKELMLIWPEFTGGWVGEAVARAVGLRAKIDQDTGWHKTLSNVAVNGVTGISADVFFDLGSSDTPAGILNDTAITTIIRRDGFRFWGNRTTSDDPLFAFESTVRTRQVLRDTIAEGLVWANDLPITASWVKDVIETINAKFRQLTREGRIIGAKAWYDPSLNDATTLSGGKVAIDFDYTPCAPAEDITLNMRLTDRYYADLANQLTTI